MTTPVEVLQKMAATYEERQQQYGEAYLMTGKVLQVLFPDGIVLSSESEFNKWHLLDQIVAKLCRYAMSGKTHADSVHDIAVYAAMIESMGTCCCMDRTAFDVDYTHVCGCKSKEERITEIVALSMLRRVVDSMKDMNLHVSPDILDYLNEKGGVA